MNDRERSAMWIGLQAIGWWRVLGALTTLIGAVASATWIVALVYTAQADPAAVARNADGIRIARDSIQILAGDSYDADARHDRELTRLSAQDVLRDQQADSILVELRNMRLSFDRFLCGEDGGSRAYCERTHR